MPKLLIVSFDALGDEEFDLLRQYPRFRALAARCAVARGVPSLLLSNTYPVHTSVVTGVVPGVHGLVSNTEPRPAEHQKWCTDASLIRTRTLWQAAHEKGLRTAAVMWPVTGRARQIRYNVPEVMAMPGKSQVLTSLAAGSKWLQLRLFRRHRRLLAGAGQLALDRFAGACMADILREKRPDLALMHFTAYDFLCHLHGRGSPELRAALEVMDAGLGALLDAAGEKYHVILFSDHAQLDARRQILPEMLLSGFGGRRGCFVECCGGAAFLHPGGLDDAGVRRLRARIAATDGFGRFLTPQEMAACGRPELPFGFSAAVGYCFLPHEKAQVSNHGYPPDYDHYRVFYMACGARFAAGRTVRGGSLLDIAPLAAELLGLDLPAARPVRADVFRPADSGGGDRA